MAGGAPRRLGIDDAAVVEQACTRFGLRGDLDVRAFLERQETTVFVVEVETGVAGWVYGHELVHPDGERTMLLYALDVDVAYRGKGHGAALVRAFVEDAAARGCTEVWVLTDPDNDAALATYSSAGGRRDEDVQVMLTWKLADGRHS